VSTDVRDNKTLSRFELDADGGTAAAYYSIDGNEMTLHHTETPPALQGRGIATRLVVDVLEQARARGLKVVPRCGFVASVMEQHPEFNDLLA
jgi:predicted GNAT family acetyltransferase